VAKSRCEVWVEPGAIERHYAAAEAAAMAERWLAVFGNDRQGINAKAYPWHIFCADRYPNVPADRAWEEYAHQEAVAYIVLSNDLKQAFLTPAKPMRCAWIDCLVFPPNLAWTFARTHEEGWLGPYFARHPRHAELDAENRAALRKQHEAQVARSKGWC